MGESLTERVGRILSEEQGSGLWRDEDADRRQAEDLEAAQLIERVKAGDRQAFSTLYSLYFDRLYAYLRLLLNDPHEAEDAAQQVFLQAYEALPAYEQRRSFWVWLFIIARNYAVDQLKKQSRVRLEEPLAIGQRQDRSLAQEELPALRKISNESLLSFVERLPLAQRQVVALRYMLDLSNPEIGVILDRSPQEIALLHHRALKFLKTRLTAIGRGPRHHDRATSRRPVKVAPVIRSRRFAL